MTGWHEELLGVVRHWARRTTPGARTSRRLGVAHRAGGAGWYRVDALPDGCDPDRLREPRLVHPTASAGHRVLHAETAGGALRLRVSAHVDDPVLTLHGSPAPESDEVNALRSALETLGDPGLAADLVRGAPARGVARTTAPPGLDPQQQQAYAACRTPGLHLVWAPPGTGRTRVLARAAADLLAGGHRVLLVAPGGGDVDEALFGMLRHHRPGQGVAVRVGPAPSPEIGRDADVGLQWLVAHHTTKLTRQRENAEQELVRLTAPARELAAVTRHLADVDEARYQRALRLERNDQRRDEAVEAFAAAWYAASEAETEHERADAQRERSARRQAELRPAANLLAEAATLERELAELRATHEHTTATWQAALRMLQAQDEQAGELAAMSRWHPIRGRSAVRAHQQRQARLRSHVQQARDALDRSAADTESRAAVLDARIRRLREQAAPVDDAAVRAADGEHEQVSAHHRATRERLTDAREAADAAAEELRQAEALPRLGAVDWNVLIDARARGIPQLLERRGELASALAASRARIRGLEQRQEKLAADLDRLRPGVEHRIVDSGRLVATTLEQAVTHPAVLGAPYDAVLVDDAGAAPLPHLVAVLARARRTAVLFGTSTPGGPELPDRLNPHRPDVKAWLARDAFGCCGITGPRPARQRAIALHHQYRLPPALTELVNRIAQDGTLVCARDADGDPRLAVVDVDGLGELATVQSAGRSQRWWQAGAMLGAALARRHGGGGDAVESLAVLTPGTRQAELTLEAVREVPDGPPDTAVGAGVHCTAGRRTVDVTVLDLVHAGSGEEPADAAALLALAATRPRERLYLIGSATGLRAARRGGALGAVAAMLDAGQVQLLPAADLLGETADQRSA